MQTAPGLRGIRQQLHWHANPQYRFADRPDLVNDPAWRRGLREVGRRGLLFELQLFADQMADGARLAADLADVPIVLLHAGMLEDRSLHGWGAWRAGMQQLARCPNVSVKLSGLGTFEHRCDADLWRPVVEETLALFGAGRCMFGSNFPVEKLWTSYAQILDVMADCLARLTGRERAAVWHDTAARVYRPGTSPLRRGPTSP
jgi:predicted TIM-barrel fold metal-dependent hydrolase